MIRRICLILAILTLPTACHQQQKAGHGEISGQILPGSISDAMLPYDTVKSKAPVAPPEVAQPADSVSSGATADSAAMIAGSAASAPDVAASPAPVLPPAVN